MKQLEMVYLMKVILHLKDMEDIQNIEMINKKCGSVISALKINPWFTSERDINKFCRIFNPPTCNCNLLNVDESVLTNVENIRNYDLGHFIYSIKGNDRNNQLNQQQITEEQQERLGKIIQKVESMTCFSYASEKIIEVIIQKMKKGIKIRCSDEFEKKFDCVFNRFETNSLFYKFDNSLANFIVSADRYPSEMIIQGDTDGSYVKEPEKKNIILINSRIKKDIKILKGIKLYLPNIVLLDSNNERNVTFIRSSVSSLFSNITPTVEQSGNGISNVNVDINNFIDEESRENTYKILNDLYATSVSIYGITQGVDTQNVTPINISLLPEYIKNLYIYSSDQKLIINQQSVEHLEILGQKSFVELQSVDNLKRLKLQGVNKLKISKMKEEQQIISTNKRRYWKEIQEIANIFSSLEEFQLNQCFNLNINVLSNNLKSIEMINSTDCQINIKSDCIERLKLEGNKQTQFKLSTNKSSKICIKGCEIFKLKIESNNEQNIEIAKGNQINVKSKCPINKLIIAESKEVSIIGNKGCNTMKVIESTINKIDIKPKKIIFKSIEEYIKVSLKEAEEIYIVSMKEYIFEELFDKCKKLYIDECENCQFIINKNQIKEMKITKCKNTEITGKLDNIEEIITIDNEECNIPETKNNIKEDTEIIEINNTNKDIEIETDKKYVIIRNIHDRKIKIRSDINSDVTIENCKNITLEGEYEEYGNINFINCKNKVYNQNQKNKLTIGSARSILFNNCESIEFNMYKIRNLLEIINSKIGIRISSKDNNIIDTINIENSELYHFTLHLPSNKANIINSTGVGCVVQQCQEELTLKRMDNIRSMLNESLKKLEMEECNGIAIPSNVKGKEVKMVRCHFIKMVDTSNSITQIECDNVEVITQTVMIGRGPIGGNGIQIGEFIPNNMPIGGFGGGFVH
ncbi:hypothetical protein, conserved [Entamoeba dispar SAW760]|uniref:Uncharacterized protein n=1 Tax=Entamoeba dispar (strain ATCC PRA-260 / SAW760) TaxID=370354 RepID=B0ERT5_ENTDS|nr:uncharacterized protein EDI_336290 [Entamoeba dispar SAW760]EDR22730.1 hypothetical protein, conserved [Entamoeba dispar SAW760]|eukprot:EDR22730.1 hypothetical protein, conserved [Entamoeba dispar SAW760]